MSESDDQRPAANDDAHSVPPAESPADEAREPDVQDEVTEFQPSADPFDAQTLPGNPYGTPQYGTPQYGTPQYGTPQYGTPYYGAPYEANQFGADPFGAFPPAAPMQTAPDPPRLGAAFSWAGSRFSANIGVLVGAAALWAAIIIGAALLAGVVIGLVVLAVSGFAVDVDESVSIGAAITSGVIAGIAVAAITGLATSCWLNGLITIADGKRADIGDFFRPVALGPILLVTLIVSAVSTVADLLLSQYLGLEWISLLVSLALTFLTIWMVYFAADTGAGVGPSLSNGLNLSAGRAGPTLVVLLIALLITIAGALALLVGLLFAMPFAGLLTLYYFRALTRRPIAQ
ncbi:proline-rich domain-containing protein [Gordonia iterans]|nr:proline-rich domain-containing protein [Gordonia iterans]